MSRIDPEMRVVLLEMRDLMKGIHHEIMHLVELCRFDLCISPKRKNDR